MALLGLDGCRCTLLVRSAQSERNAGVGAVGLVLCLDAVDVGTGGEVGDDQEHEHADDSNQAFHDGLLLLGN